MLDMVFSQHDLAWMDDLLPEKEKKKKEDNKKKGKEAEKEKKKPKQDDSEEEVSALELLLPPAGGTGRDTSFLTMCVCVCVSAGQAPRLLQPLAQLRVGLGSQVLCPQTAHPLQRSRLP